MWTYSFSIFVRGYIAFSGLCVFFVSASLFGAAGRGVIGYGTSLFAALGIFLSFNLGRAFLQAQIEDSKNRDSLLFQCLSLNGFASLLTMGAGILYWQFSPSAQKILSISEILGFSMTSFFCVWSHNGHLFYSSYLKTKVQDFLIFLTRTAIILFLAGLILFHSKTNLTTFIWVYALLLLGGTLLEMTVVQWISKAPIRFTMDLKSYGRLIRKTLWPHLDYIFFHIFPLLLMVLSAGFLSVPTLGKINFATQMINFIFLFSTTAHMRVNAYVANGGIQDKFDKFWKLMALTALASLLSAILLYFAIHFLPSIPPLKSFTGSSRLYLISLAALPGYILFQFFNPLWIEKGRLKSTVLLQGLNLLICLMLSPFLLKHFGEQGYLMGFSLFYFNNIPLHLWLYRSVFGRQREPLKTV